MIGKRNIHWTDILFYSITTILYIIFLYLIGRNIFLQEMWFDEAGQVFMSHGLNHWSDPMMADGSFRDALIANHDYNLDPGGYTVLLYFWCKISSAPEWLRLLSYIFFLGAIALTCLISNETLRNKKYAYASGLMVFCLIHGTIAFEVRAYSMELCGFAYGIWMVLKLRKPVKLSKILAMSIVLCIFITSRYTMLVIGGVLSCFVLALMLAQFHRNIFGIKELCARALTYSCPLLITVFLVWKYQTSLQNSDVSAINYVRYLEDWKIILIYFILASLFLVSNKWQNANSRILIYLFIAINGIFIFLGSLEILPWNIVSNKGSLFLYSLYLTLFNCSLTLISQKRKAEKIIPYGLLVCWGIYTFAINKYVGLANINGGIITSVDRAEGIIEAVNISKGPIYISAWCTPEVRYMYEFGSLRSRATADGYPNRFKFLHKGLSRGGSEQINYRALNESILDTAGSGSVIYSPYSRESIPPSYKEVKHGLFIKQ